MSTYLLAFVVGEFDHVSAMTKHGVVIRVYCPPGKRHPGTSAPRHPGTPAPRHLHARVPEPHPHLTRAFTPTVPHRHPN